MRVHILAALAVATSVVSAQHGSSPGVRIDESTEGARLFRAQCAGCHGADGSGTGAGPALNRGSFKRGSSDEAIVATVSKGVPGTTMPAFSWDAKQMPQIVAHIRSLAIVKAATAVPGDIEAGRTLFSNSCAGCHTPAGMFTGPDLMQVAARLSAAELRQSIIEPGAVVPSQYWSISARTVAGQVVEGIRINEDTSSVQFRERNGKLRSVLKKDLASYEIIRKSPMPSFQAKLSDKQVDDIVAFLIRGQQ